MTTKSRKTVFVGIICCILWFIPPKAQSLTYEEFLHASLPQLCPYNNFCAVNQSEILTQNGRVPCCSSCSCDSKCLLIGNCCPDFPALLTPEGPPRPTAVCSPPVHYSYTDIYTAVRKYPAIAFHYITRTCPARYHDSEVIDKCIRPDSLELTDHVIVSDESGHVFFNRYCAECNGAQTLTTWNLQLVCSMHPDQMTYLQDPETLRRYECLIISSPPKPAVGLMSRCEPVTHSRCNITGRWAAFNAHTQRACETTTFPLQKNSYVFNNIYCYICNEGNDIEINTQCMAGRTGIGQYPFAALLKTVGQTGLATTDDFRCHSTQMYDHHFEKCRPLNCPVTQLPRDGNCAQVYKPTNSFTVFVQIEVTYEDETTRVYFHDFDRFAEQPQSGMDQIALAIYSGIGIRSNACSKCITLLFRKADRSRSTFLLGVKTGRKCTVESVLERLKTATTKKVIDNFVIEGVQLAFSMEVGYGITEAGPLHGYLLHYLLVAKPHCPSPIYLKPAFYCPHVDLSANDYQSLLSSNITHLADFTAVAIGDTSQVYRICVDRYIGSKGTEVSASPSVLPHIMSVAITVLVMLQKSSNSPAELA